MLLYNITILTYFKDRKTENIVGYHIHVVYKCALAKSKGRGKSLLPLRRVLVCVPVLAALLRRICGFGGGRCGVLWGNY